MITGEGGDTAVVGHGVDKVDVPVSNPVDAEYDDVIASSTDGLPFRNNLRRKEKKEIIFISFILLDGLVYYSMRGSSLV